MARLKLKRSRPSSTLDAAKVGVKAKRIVRYPAQSKALRALLDEAPASRSAMTIAAPKTRPAPPQGSKPSAEALRLILEASPAAGNDAARMSRRSAEFIPRLEPVDVLDEEVLGRVVRMRRAMLGLSQQQLAERADVGRRFVGELEAGKPTAELRKTLQICRALGLGLTLQVSDGR